jgi:hypothetical protein
MSVITLISNPIVRQRLDLLLPKGLYERTQRAALLVPRTSLIHPSIIGTAVDYALRFQLGRACPDAVEKPWVAEASVRSLAMSARFSSTLKHAAPRVGLVVGVDDDRRAHRRAARRVRNARVFVRKHLRRQRLDDAWFERLAVHALNLARLDPVYRAGYRGPALFAANDQAAIAEVVAMVRAAPIEAWASGRTIHLNPTFGRFSLAVGGADCDLISGDEIVDFKVASEPHVERHMVRQLVVYSMLAESAREDGQPLPPIRSIAIYFPRQAHTWRLDLASVRSHAAYEETKAWLLRPRGRSAA